MPRSCARLSEMVSRFGVRREPHVGLSPEYLNGVIEEDWRPRCELLRIFANQQFFPGGWRIAERHRKVVAYNTERQRL